MNVVFVFGVRLTPSLESASSTWVMRVSCQGMVTRDDGRTTSVVSNDRTSPSLVQLTISWRSLSISSSTVPSTSHVLPSAVVYLSVASCVNAHSKPDTPEHHRKSAFDIANRKCRTCIDSATEAVELRKSAPVVYHLWTTNEMVYALTAEWRRGNSTLRFERGRRIKLQVFWKP